MKMYLLIKCSEDGDSYQTFSNLDEAKKVFNEEKKGGWHNNLVLCEIGPDQTFGFGSQGFFHGSDVVKEWDREEDEEDEDEDE